MKRLSLKIKLTLLYTFFMVLATCAVLAILLSLSNREILAGAQSRLERRVQDSADDVTLEDGGLRVDSDFYSVAKDVYLSLYTEDMYFLYGRVPYGFDVQPEIADGRTRRIAEGNTDWYVYDMSFRLAEDYTVYLRGITSVTDAEASFGVTIRFAVILFPLMALVTAVIGYRFTRRTLLPVKQITRTVQKIRADADLSRRIGLKAPEGRERRNRDEIYGLASTFDDMLEELEEVFQREKQFTSDVSHELRTPISVILAQCAECLEDEGLTARQREQLLLIERKAKDMAGMISQLLFLSRADQGRQPLQRETVNVSELTLMTAEEQQLLADAEGRGVRISCDAGSDITACVDETLFIRLLVNLISNAVSYSRPNGKVTVSLSCADGELTGTVCDNGIGISEEDLPHIWERFYRADASRQPGGHSGLGLSMVKWIAEAHGGSVEAESRLGEGSTFTFHMPAGEPEEKN
ncbi:MAG TPA: HAMP domain-containing histidine kinase [Candidatus Mediterraneibacter faecigallinarum]|uniref:histidine kinase n=1 Tax=Candidatus Mediterraneibacter faecigallinarum TaxID=2838669 RepID=A0A9D2SZB0_9FIRM|nr:HAMP domain-containing histidine kinase [Candidatus Mediterraneibacter faecigallinarum]